MSLRARLLLGLIALSAIGLLAASAVTYRELKTHLINEKQEQLDRVFEIPPNVLLYADEPPIPAGTFVILLDGSPNPPDRGYAYPGEEAPRWPERVTSKSRFTLSDPHFLAGSEPTPSGVLLVAITMRDVDETLHRLFVIELIVAVGVLAALAIVAWGVVNLGLYPLRQMQETAGAIAAGDLSRRVEVVDEKTEVGRLGVALNEMLQQIQNAFDERAASEARLRRFVGDASHELRTPLTSIRGYAELFRRGAAERPEDLAKAMRRIEEEADRMGVLVDDLLLLARLDQGRPLERQPVDLTRIAADAVDDTRTVAPERNISYSPNGAVVVPGDEVRLRQVLANLLTNAVRHTPPETPVYVEVHADDTSATIEVRDEGPGMPPEEAARAFERFWRADSSRARTSGGTGLGLAIVAAIAEAHGGTAEVVTAPGEGATFRIRLPRQVPDAPAEN